MNKFRKLGFIDDNGDITVNHALLSVVLQDDPAPAIKDRPLRGHTPIIQVE